MVFFFGLNRPADWINRNKTRTVRAGLATRNTSKRKEKSIVRGRARKLHIKNGIK
jgi:hypothetical protein